MHMKLFDTFDAVQAELGAQAATTVTIGVFDGLHLGHQTLIRKTTELARARGLVSLVITFPQHPLGVLAPPYCPKRLIYSDRKLQVLDSLRVDLTACVPFTREFAEQDPSDFLSDTLIRRCRVRSIICGYDFAFGRGGTGNISMLRNSSRELGFDLSVIEPVNEHDILVKSTMIRDLLYGGQVDKANRLLTRPYELRGTVVTGFGRGRQIGFPTANLDVDADHVIPARGVYLCAANIEGEQGINSAMVNIGYNPTFGSSQLTIEAHLLKFAGDLTGKRVKLFFLKRLRDERRFENAQQLIEQLRRDQMTCFFHLGAGDLTPTLQAIIKLLADEPR